LGQQVLQERLALLASVEQQAQQSELVYLEPSVLLESLVPLVLLEPLALLASLAQQVQSPILAYLGLLVLPEHLAPPVQRD
jgi:hypothetical protein